MTRLSRRLQNSAIFLRAAGGIGRSQRHSRMSGWMPRPRSSLVECWVGLVFSSPAEGIHGTRVKCTKSTRSRPSSLPSWRIASRKGQALDVADRAADLAKDEILAVEIGLDELLDRVGDVGDDLDRRPEIFAAPFAADHGRIDPPGRDRIAAPRGDPDIALVMAEIEIGLGTVVGDVDLAVLVGAHRAGIDVQVGVELAQPDPEPARLQQRSERRRRQTLAERGNHAAGDEDEPRHGISVYSIRWPHPKGKCGAAKPFACRS